MERTIFLFEHYHSNYSNELLGEFEFFTIGGDYTIKVFQNDTIMVTLPNGKYFMTEFASVMDDNPNHHLLQYEDGRVLKWIRSIIATNFLDSEQPS